MDSKGESTGNQKRKTHRKEEKYIHEDADTIVDLADIKAMSSIASEYSYLIKDKIMKLTNLIFFSKLPNQKNILGNSSQKRRKAKIPIVDSKQILAEN